MNMAAIRPPTTTEASSALAELSERSPVVLTTLLTSPVRFAVLAGAHLLFEHAPTIDQLTNIAAEALQAAQQERPTRREIVDAIAWLDAHDLVEMQGEVIVATSFGRQVAAAALGR